MTSTKPLCANPQPTIALVSQTIPTRLPERFKSDHTLNSHNASRAALAFDNPHRTLQAPAPRPPTARHICHSRSADLQPRGLIRLQFRDRLCIRTRAMQQPMHAIACGARRGSRCWLSALGLRRAAAYHTGSQPATPNQRPSATANSRPSAYPASTSER